MKRIYLFLLGAALLATPMLRAQNFAGVSLTPEKVNVDKLRKEVEKSDAEIADPKKGAKAATWVKRGEILLDVDSKPVNGLFAGLDEVTFKIAFGEAPMEEVVLHNNKYAAYTYEFFKVYLSDGKVQFYVPTIVVTDDAIGRAYDAFSKAYDMDKKSAKKVNFGMKNIHMRSQENGKAYYVLADYKLAEENFRMAYKASVHPSVNIPDTLSLYNAGFMGTLAGDYEAALTDLDTAIEMGFDDNGDAYYYKFYCLYQLKKVDEATKVLEYGITKYPNNDRVLGALMDVYSITPDKDPSNLVPLVLNVIEQYPNNADLYVGLARIYDKLGQEDDAIEAARKAVEVNPESFLGNYYTGYYIAKKGENEDNKLRQMTITSRAQYQTARAEVIKIYAASIAPLEKAYELNPSEPSTIELLKNLTFRLRDDEEMAAKNKKYEALVKAAKGE